MKEKEFKIVICRNNSDKTECSYFDFKDFCSCFYDDFSLEDADVAEYMEEYYGFELSLPIVGKLTGNTFVEILRMANMLEDVRGDIERANCEEAVGELEEYGYIDIGTFEYALLDKDEQTDLDNLWAGSSDHPEQDFIEFCNKVFKSHYE